MRFLLIPVLLMFALAGCTGPASATDASHNTPSDGRKLYEIKCAKCHKFYDPTKYPDEEWSRWMEKMTKKAKLKPELAELLTHYIDEELRKKK